MPEMEPDLYEVLQVHPRAEPEVIDAAFRRLTRKYHPDVNSSPDAADVMGRLTAAYDVLRDPDRRAAYDRRRAASHRRRAEPRDRDLAQPNRDRAEDRAGEGVIEVSLLGGLSSLGLRWRKRSP